MSNPVRWICAKEPHFIYAPSSNEHRYGTRGGPLLQHFFLVRGTCSGLAGLCHALRQAFAGRGRRWETYPMKRVVWPNTKYHSSMYVMRVHCMNTRTSVWFPALFLSFFRFWLFFRRDAHIVGTICASDTFCDRCHALFPPFYTTPCRVYRRAVKKLYS